MEMNLFRQNIAPAFRIDVRKRSKNFKNDLIIRRAITLICELPTAPKCLWRHPHKKIIKP
jgi:hypothetical protein